MNLRKATTDRNQQFVDMFSTNDTMGFMMLLCELYEQEWRMWLVGSSDYKLDLPELRRQYLALRKKIKDGCNQHEIPFEDVYKQRDEIVTLNAQKGVPFFDDEGFPVGGFPDESKVSS
jgi:hypothetical protein